MRDVSFCTDAFSDPRTRAYSERVLGCLLWALVFANESYLITHKQFPMLYNAGMRWEAETPTPGLSKCPGGNGQEKFFGVRQAYEAKAVDCEDLAMWRVAETRLGRGTEKRGKPPRPGHPEPTIVPVPFPMRPIVGTRPAFYSRMTSPRVRMYHIVVAWPDGSFEDPSRELGMGGFS